MNYTIKDYLLASPFSSDTDFNGELTEDIFYRDYFVGGDEGDTTYLYLNNKISSFLEEVSPQLPLSIFLYGFSGTGKTTYIRWYAKEFLKSFNVLFFDFTDDFDEDDIERIGQIKIFHNHFKELLCDLYAEIPHKLNDLFSCIEGIKMRIINELSHDFFEALGTSTKEEGLIINNDFVKIMDKSSYEDLLLIILLLYHFYPEKLNHLTKKDIDISLPTLLVFDNIDHVEIEQHNADFPRRIEGTYYKFKKIIRKLKRNHIDTFCFLFSLRDANCAIINRQLADIRSRRDVEFNPSLKETDILSKRISIALGKYVQLNKEKLDFLNFIFNDEYTKKVFLPLFNFNIRKMAEFFVGIVQNTYSENLYYKQIFELSQNTETVHGSRGIEYFHIIKYLLRWDYLKEKLFLDDGKLIGGPEGGYVNPARILLTNLHNLNQFAMNIFTGKANPKPVDVSLLYKNFHEIFSEPEDLDMFFDILTNIFLFHRSNWCHLISFTNEYFSNKTLLSAKNKLKKGLSDTNIKVQLNPSGFIYIRDIIRHYEFFSIRTENQKPLFCQTKYRLRGDDKIILNGLNNIENTYRVTKECIESLNKFLRAGKVKNFELTNHCFRVYSYEDDFKEDFFENNHGRIYIVRIIDLHINYIDTYRIYVLNFNEDVSQLHMKYKKQINQDILNYIEKYVRLLENTECNGSKKIEKLVSIFKTNIQKIKLSGYSDFETNINAGRESAKVNIK